MRSTPVSGSADSFSEALLFIGESTPTIICSEEMFE